MIFEYGSEPARNFRPTAPSPLAACAQSESRRFSQLVMDHHGRTVPMTSIGENAATCDLNLWSVYRTSIVVSESVALPVELAVQVHLK